MKDCFKVIGYYICEINDTPGWFQGISRQILSVSGCIGEQHPRWECFMGGWLKGEAREYQEKLRLDGEQYREFSETANCLRCPKAGCGLQVFEIIRCRRFL